MKERDRVEAWIAEARRGDRTALAKLLATFHPALLQHAETAMDAALKARVSPEDVLQEVYLDVAQRIDQFTDQGPDSFRHWLYAILNQKLADAQRAAHRKLRDVTREVSVAGSSSSSYWNLLDNLHAESGTPSHAVRREEALRALLSCVAELPEPQRQVMQLRYVEGRSVEEVAAHLGKTKAAVVALSQRARESLRNSMDRLGDFTHGS